MSSKGRAVKCDWSRSSIRKHLNRIFSLQQNIIVELGNETVARLAAAHDCRIPAFIPIRDGERVAAINSGFT